MFCDYTIIFSYKFDFRYLSSKFTLAKHAHFLLIVHVIFNSKSQQLRKQIPVTLLSNETRLYNLVVLISNENFNKLKVGYKC